MSKTYTLNVERLLDILKEKGVKQTRIAELFGKDRSMMSKAIKHGRRWTIGEALKIADFLDLPISEFMYDAEGFAPNEKMFTNSVVDVNKSSTDAVRVPFYDIAASAGYGTTIDREKITKWVVMPIEALRSLDYTSTDNLAYITIDGSSMEPTISHGDAVLLDCGDHGPADGIYALRYDGQLRIKRLRLNPATKMVTIISDNPLFGEEPNVNPLDLDIIGKVVWIGKKA